MRVCLAAFAVVVLGGLAVGRAEQGPDGKSSRPEWPGWGGPNRNFSTSATGLAKEWPAGGPPTVWSRALGEGHSSIVVDGGRLYTMYRPATGERKKWAPEEVIVALDAATGKTVWEHRFPASLETMDFSYGAGPHATPLVVGNRLFAASSDKQFFALDKETGRVLWSHHFVKELGAPPNQMRFAVMPGYAASPIAYGDTVIAMVGGKNQGVVAFKQDTGAIVWKGGDFEDDITPASPQLITLEGQVQLVVLSGDGAHGMDPATGRLFWSTAFATRMGANMTSPVWSAADQRLFITPGSGSATRAIELHRSGEQTQVKELWTTTRMRMHFSNVVQIGDYYYGSSGDFGPAILTALDGRTGEVAWQDRRFAKASLLNIGEGRVIFLDEEGLLVLAQVTPEKLVVVSQHQVLTNPARTAPTLVGTTLYVRDHAKIMALNVGAP